MWLVKRGRPGETKPRLRAIDLEIPRNERCRQHGMRYLESADPEVKTIGLAFPSPVPQRILSLPRVRSPIPCDEDQWPRYCWRPHKSILVARWRNFLHQYLIARQTPVR